MRLAACLALLLWAAPAWSQSLQIPSEVKGSPGAFIRVDAKTDGKMVRFVALDAGLNVFPSDMLKTTTSTVVTGQAGRYRLLAVSALGDVPSEPQICLVVIGDGPAPPGPGPVPPGPTPPIPPDDPLAVAISTAFSRDAALDPNANQWREKLAALYRQSAATDFNVATWGKLFDALAAASSQMGMAGKIMVTRTAIAAELKRVLPTNPDQPLDAAGKALAAKTFARIAAVLEGIR